jgi:hypothetical protein
MLRTENTTWIEVSQMICPAQQSESCRSARTRTTRFRFVAAAAVLLCTLGATSAAIGTELLSEDFDDDPVANGRATISGDADRFTYNAADGGSVLSSYDTGLSTSKMSWDLGATLTQETDFSFDVEFLIRSENFFADPNAFAQIAFGLVNSSTTGNDRVGGTFDDAQAAFDVVAFDYFPNVSNDFGGPSLAPTVIESNGGEGFFSHIRFVSGLEAGLDYEGALPLDQRLTVSVDYSAASRTVTMQLLGAAGGLDINSVGDGFVFGGLDGDGSTIQNILSSEDTFELDSFALTLWEDTFGGGASTVIAGVEFYGLTVESDSVMVPEPGGLMLIGSGGLLLGLWRISRHRRRGVAA